MPSLLYSIPVEWFEIRQRFHYLAEALASRHEVTVVAPRSHKRLINEKQWIDLLRPWSSVSFGHGRIVSVATLPFYRKHPALIRYQWKTNITRLAKALKGKKFDYLIIADPTQSALADIIPHDKLIYECVDDHAGFWQDATLKAAIMNSELLLAKRADLVIATSALLAKRFEQINPSVIHIGNGTDVEYFIEVTTRAFPRPVDLPAGKLVGFYGAIGD